MKTTNTTRMRVTLLIIVMVVLGQNSATASAGFPPSGRPTFKFYSTMPAFANAALHYWQQRDRFTPRLKVNITTVKSTLIVPKVTAPAIPSVPSTLIAPSSPVFHTLRTDANSSLFNLPVPSLETPASIQADLQRLLMLNTPKDSSNIHTLNK